MQPGRRRTLDRSREHGVVRQTQGDSRCRHRSRHDTRIHPRFRRFGKLDRHVRRPAHRSNNQPIHLHHNRCCEHHDSTVDRADHHAEHRHHERRSVPHNHHHSLIRGRRAQTRCVSPPHWRYSKRQFISASFLPAAFNTGLIGFDVGTGSCFVRPELPQTL